MVISIAFCDFTLWNFDSENFGLVFPKFSSVSYTHLDVYKRQTYGNPEITKVNIGVGTRPGILVSGHDLRDLEMLLKQAQGSGVDAVSYTHLSGIYDYCFCVFF